MKREPMTQEQIGHISADIHHTAHSLLVMVQSLINDCDDDDQGACLWGGRNLCKHLMVLSNILAGGDIGVTFDEVYLPNGMKLDALLSCQDNVKHLR